MLPWQAGLGIRPTGDVLESRAKERVTWRARSTQRRWRLALIAVATLGLVLAATSFWWLPAIFHTELGDEALVGLVAIVASAATYLTAQLMRR